jgi:hypothetical protein
MTKSIVFKQVEEHKSKHNKTIKSLISRLNRHGDYDYIGNNIEYKFKGENNIIGEIDTYAARKVNDTKYLLLFEVKTNNTPYGKAKAISQLRRSKETLKYLADRIKTYYVYFDPFSKGFVHTEEIK